jgi:3-oxoacyl-[acyl-carrier-protein] synthase-3
VEPSGTSDLGARASRVALTSAGFTPQDIDFIVFATINPDVTFPGAACFLQDKLGCRTVGALDVRGQCTGFLVALTVADQFIRNGVYRRVLAVGGELHSVWVDYSAKGADLARRFGDGAGAVVLGPGEEGRGVLASVLHADGRGHDRYWCEYPASRQHPVRITADNVRDGTHYPRMDVEAVRRFGEESLPAVIREAVGRADLRVDDIDRFIIGHVLPETVVAAATALKVETRRLSNPAAVYGHLGGAALPVALSEDLAAGRIGTGARLCLAAAGAGFAWGATVMQL